MKRTRFSFPGLMFYLLSLEISPVVLNIHSTGTEEAPCPRKTSATTMSVWKGLWCCSQNINGYHSILWGYLQSPSTEYATTDNDQFHCISVCTTEKLQSSIIRFSFLLTTAFGQPSFFRRLNLEKKFGSGGIAAWKTMADGPSPTLAPTPGTRCLTLCDNHQI